MKKGILMTAIFSFLGVMAVSAKAKKEDPNVVPIYTSCGEIAYIDTNRTSMENTMAQVLEIERALCG